MGVPLPAFQISGGIILFLFALTMIFGDSKPESEVKIVRTEQDPRHFSPWLLLPSPRLGR